MNEGSRTMAREEGGVWARLLYAILFGFLFYFAQVLLGAVVVVQFLAKLLTGRTVQGLGSFGQGLATYFHNVIRFLTFGSDSMPWPFSAWSDEVATTVAPAGETPAELRDDNLWRRLVHIVLFIVAFNLSVSVLAVLVVVQFLWRMATGAALARGAEFGQSLASFVYEVVMFLTYRTDDLPWPFAAWPQSAPRAHGWHVDPTVIITEPPPRQPPQRRRPNLSDPGNPGGPSETV